MEKRVPEHEHPLRLRDLMLEYEEYEDEHEAEEDIEDIIIPQDFHSTCKLCEQEINWLHRYVYECGHSCDFALHKFCAELPATINHKLHTAHTLTLFRTDNPLENSEYRCLKCKFSISARHAMATTEYQVIHHPSHPHPLVPFSKGILRECDACGKEHKGIFYQCTTCFGLFIHKDCAFLPKKLFIQDITTNNFFHRHLLALSYSFPKAEQTSKLFPTCKICDNYSYDENLWILKCEKCRYYAHLSCATSGGGDSSSSLGKRAIQNFKDSDYPNLLRLPFPTVSDSILKHLFLDKVECENFKMEDRILEHKCHPHPLILVRTESGGTDIGTPSSSRTIVLSCHDPMKKIELLCNGCLRPITNMPFYKCANEDNKCDFVVHEWCIQLPDKIHNYMDHKQHTLVLQPNASTKFFSVFECAVCWLPCNGFLYSCVECDDYHIDVTCAFIPEKITHEAHPGHLMSRAEVESLSGFCRLCCYSYGGGFAFRCDTCIGVWIHTNCAMLLAGEIRHVYDKHPMRISYREAIENHKSQYFCEICEEEFDPERCSFYHCYAECAQSIHSCCSPLILQSEKAIIYPWVREAGVYKFVNIKFGGMLYKMKDHPHHPLIFDQGIESDGHCSNCGRTLKGKMMFKCQQCSSSSNKYAIHFKCCKRLSVSAAAN